MYSEDHLIRPPENTDPVQALIAEMRDAYVSSYSSVNMDYAAFASLSLEDFRRLLKSPGLSGQQLRAAIRRGHLEHGRLQPDSSWAHFISQYVKRSAND